MKLITKLLSLLMVAAMLYSMVACTTSPAPSSSPAPIATSAPTQSEKTAVSPAATETPAPAAESTGSPSAPPESSSDLIGPYTEPVTVNMVASTTDVLDNQLAALGESYENNRWTKLIKDRLNIDVKYIFVAKGALFGTKLNVMLSAGDMPDILNVSSATFKQLMDNDMIGDLTEVYSKYTGPDYKGVVDKDPLLIKSATFDGKIMGLGNSCSLPYSTMDVLWIRADWLKKLGLAEPGNITDLFNIAKAFKENNPDGVPVTAGYGMSNDFSFFGYNLFANAYHAYPSKWVEKNGKLVYGSLQGEMIDTLMALADWYKAGLIDPEFLTKDQNKIADEFNTGKIGITGYFDYLPLLLPNFNVNHPDQDLRAYPMVSADSTPCSPESYLGENVPSWFVVRKGYEHPEALMKMTNLILMTLYGSEKDGQAPDGTTNSTYFTAPTNAPQFYSCTPLWYNIQVDVNLNRYKCGEALETGDTSIVDPADLYIYKNMLAYKNGDQTQWGWFKSFCKDGGGAYALKYYSDNKLGFINAFRGLPTDTMVQKMGLIDSKINEIFAKIIMGQSDVGEFNTAIKNFQDMGGTDITKEVNDWYQSNKNN